MTVEELQEIFEKHMDEEYLQFDRETSPMHSRLDICALLLLHELDQEKKPGRDMIVASRHDEIWFGADVRAVAEKATEEQIITLIRCGVGFDADRECFFMSL